MQPRFLKTRKQDRLEHSASGQVQLIDAVIILSGFAALAWLFFY